MPSTAAPKAGASRFWQMLLLDEPMSNLDVALRVKMREEIRAIQQKIGITTLFITHDQQEALAISDKIAVMKDGEVLQVGTPREIYNHPNQEFVANFVGVSNKIGGHFVRPENLKLSVHSDNGIPVQIKNIRFGGMYYEYTVQAKEGEYRVIEMNYGNGTKEWNVNDTGYIHIIHEDGLVIANEK